jgi:hypothetical protein
MLMTINAGLPKKIVPPRCGGIGEPFTGRGTGSFFGPFRIVYR